MMENLKEEESEVIMKKPIQNKTRKKRSDDQENENQHLVILCENNNCEDHQSGEDEERKDNFDNSIPPVISTEYHGIESSPPEIIFQTTPSASHTHCNISKCINKCPPLLNSVKEEIEDVTSSFRKCSDVDDEFCSLNLSRLKSASSVPTLVLLTPTEKHKMFAKEYPNDYPDDNEESEPMLQSLSSSVVSYGAHPNDLFSQHNHHQIVTSGPIISVDDHHSWDEDDDHRERHLDFDIIVTSSNHPDVSPASMVSSSRRMIRRGMRRAHSLSSVDGHHRNISVVGRTRKLYCPRQPPTTLTRTLSISRTSVEFKKKLSSKLTKYQKSLLICISLVSFTSFLCMSIMAPFFPNEASEKGMSETISGLVFSTYALVVMVTSPVLGHVLPMIGAKFMLLTGIFCAGISNILFGLLDQIEDHLMFAVYCFVVRSFEALGAAAFSTASYTYIMSSFKDDLMGTAFGLTETCVGLGMSMGPAVGAGLYSLGGYGLPFYVLGSFVLLNIPLCYIIIKPISHVTSESDQEDQKKSSSDVPNHKISSSSYLKLITIPEVAVVCLVVVVVSQSQGFLDPTVEPHFRQYGLGAQFVGFVFLLMSAAYAILSPITGWIASKMDNKFPLMICGLFLSSVGLSLLGPSGFVPLDPAVWLTSVAMVIMGLAYAVAFIPTFESILIFAVMNGFDDNVRTYSLVSGLWSSMYSLGEVTGPLLGGIFVDHFDFPQAATFMATFSLIAALITVTTYMVNGGCSSTSGSDTGEDSEGEDNGSGGESRSERIKEEHRNLNGNTKASEDIQSKEADTPLMMYRNGEPKCPMMTPTVPIDIIPKDGNDIGLSSCPERIASL